MTHVFLFSRNLGLFLLGGLLVMGYGCSGSGADDSPVVSSGSCASNTCPTANAGPDQAAPVGSPVTLDGSHSVSDTTSLLTYHWSLTSKPAGSNAILANAATARPSFTPDVAGTYIAVLTVSSDGSPSAADSITIMAGTMNLSPTANAGLHRTVTVGAFVQLDGRESEDPNGTPVTYIWTLKAKPSASQTSLINRTSATPSFTADVQGNYTASLTVSDGKLSSSPDEVEIVATGGNIAPVANAGPDQIVQTGRVVTLTGVDSTDANGDAITYSWRFQSKPQGSTATLTDVHTVNPSYTPDFAGLYVLSLVVNDGQVSSQADTVAIEARLPGFVNVVLQSYVKISNSKPNNAFGNTVALSGNTLAVSAHNDGSCAPGVNGNQNNTGCVNAGAVYVFTRSNDVWSQQAYIKASNPGAQDEFVMVALSGDTLAVGAPGEDSCTTGVNGDQTNNSCENAGAAYVYIRSNGVWSQQAYIKASNPGFDDIFGSSVAVSGDTLAVGAPRESHCATGINGDDQLSGSCFRSGAAYVFTRTNDVWSQQAYVKASNVSSNGGLFGASVALSDDTLAVGRPGEESCATGINGDQLNKNCPGAGAVYVFTWANGVWSQQAYIKASNPGVSDNFGNGLALSGNTLAVGSPGEDSCATGVDGVQQSNGCSDTGAAYVFMRANGGWSQQAFMKASNPDINDAFGAALALSGETLVVAAFNEASCASGINGDQTNNGCDDSGAMYVFTRTNGLWNQWAYLKPTNTKIGILSNRVAVSGDTVAVGAPGEDSCATGINGDQMNSGCENAGAAYVFVLQ